MYLPVFLVIILIIFSILTHFVCRAYADVNIHENMIRDQSRTQTYRWEFVFIFLNNCFFIPKIMILLFRKLEFSNRHILGRSFKGIYLSDRFFHYHKSVNTTDFGLQIRAWKMEWWTNFHKIPVYVKCIHCFLAQTSYYAE